MGWPCVAFSRGLHKVPYSDVGVMGWDGEGDRGAERDTIPRGVMQERLSEVAKGMWNLELPYVVRSLLVHRYISAVT